MGSPKKTQGAVEPLHEPDDAAAATMGAAPAGALRERVLGATAIALAASIVIQNAMFGWADAPGYGDPIDDVLAWHQQQRGVVAIAVGQEALYLLLLLVFVTGLHGLVQQRRGAGADWSRLTMAAATALSAILGLYSVLWIGAVLSADGIAVPSPAFELAWRMHAAAFAVALPALGTTFIGAALAAHRSRLTPRWQCLLGVIAGGLLLAAGAASLPIAEGSAILFVGMPGYAAWPVWLFATGARLMRARAVNSVPTTLRPPGRRPTGLADRERPCTRFRRLRMPPSAQRSDQGFEKRVGGGT
ncbi:MAG: hypothetical protein R2733_09895 [Acidimicrobiales bacterium]